MDTLTPEARSLLMSKIRGKNTQPELAVRRMLFALGYRHRLHAKRLPGKPDLVFPARRKVVFVHGCFWHGHSCLKGKLPRTRRSFWAAKINGNRLRDRRHRRALAKLGWQSIVVWECKLRHAERTAARLVGFLEGEAIPPSPPTPLPPRERGAKAKAFRKLPP